MATHRVAAAACFLASAQSLQEFPQGGQPGIHTASGSQRLPQQPPPRFQPPPFPRGFPSHPSSGAYPSSGGMQPPPYNPYNTYSRPAFQPPNPWAYRPPPQPTDATGPGYGRHAGSRADEAGGKKEEPVRDAAFWEAVHSEAAKMAQLIVAQAQQLAYNNPWAYPQNPYQYQYMPPYPNPPNTFTPQQHGRPSDNFFRPPPLPQQTQHTAWKPPAEPTQAKPKTNRAEKYPPVNGVSPESPGNLPRPPPPPPGWVPFGKMQQGGKGGAAGVADVLKNLGNLESFIDKDEIQREVEKAVKAALGGLVDEQPVPPLDKSSKKKKNKKNGRKRESEKDRN
mmetsp:Transcript_24105/g.47249  ORF Transcript_24105/g.47249 Transcript_24105/m.47249 type:complete len:337 (+) Transcript_24105:41-1051(+)